MIKSYESCRDCFFGAINKYCSEGDCRNCKQFNGDNSDTMCKCNTIEPGAECPWYKENE